MNRRGFIQTASFAAAVSQLLVSCKPAKIIPGKILGASANIGHLLRDGKTGPVVSTTRKKAVIIGAGVSGLSAGRHLLEKGVTDFWVMDLEDHAGGNASHGENATSAYPLGAHYLPTPNSDLKDYLNFLESCGVITGYDEKQLPVYNDFYVCFDSQERLFINGRWQDGVIPHYGVPADELKQLERFLQMMEKFRSQKGTDGNDAFAIPVNNSSKDEVFVQLDAITMQKWMHENGFTSPYLTWYVNYCTRDDFGTTINQISAWAGIHYFAGRKGLGANATQSDVITWPEGNGFLVKALQANFNGHIKKNALALNVEQKDNLVQITWLDTTAHTMHIVEAEQCILAVPQFVAVRLLKDAARQKLVHDHIQYAPWMVANLLVSNLTEKEGIEMSWDNVIYNSQSLGYVDATHQLVQQKMPLKNITYYLPLTEKDAATERKTAQQKTHAEWTELIITDLEKVHPGIRNAIQEINVMVWGHAMAQPLPGMIHGNTRENLSRSVNNCIHFAHTDLAGISIFEEAFYQGIGAAEKLLKQL